MLDARYWILAAEESSRGGYTVGEDIISSSLQVQQGLACSWLLVQLHED